MIKKILFLLLIASTGNHAYSQFKVSGVIIGSDDSLPLPTVTVQEEGDSLNIVKTNDKGEFTIVVSSEQSVLIMTFLGYVTREISVNGRHQINTFIKPAGTQHFFRRQKLKLNLNSGVFNTPVGGELSISSPNLFNDVILEGSFSYQSNFKQNTFSKARISLLEIISSGRFNLDINFNRYSLSFQNEFSYLIRSIEFDLYINHNSPIFWNFRPTIGFDEITYTQLSDNIEDRVSRGITIGYLKEISFLNLGLYPKVTFFKDLTSYSLKVDRYFRHTEFYLQFQKTGPFTELSVGMGWKLTYYFKKQKEANTPASY